MGGASLRPALASKSKVNSRDSGTQDWQKQKGTALTRLARRGGREGEERASVSGTPVLKLREGAQVICKKEIRRW